LLGVAHVLGLMLAVFGLTYLMPVLTALLTHDGQAMHFLVAALVSSGAGLAMAAATRRYARELKPRDGFLLVTVGWLLASASATIPLLLAMPQLSFTDAFFEAMSGLTTTGSTVLTGLEGLAPSVNLWRHALHWFGGLGIIVLAVAILPLLGVGGMQLYKAQTPGPIKDEKLTPRIMETAKSLWLVYMLLTLAATLAFKACGMSWLDAVCHAFSVMSLGGFSTRDASIGAYDSVAVEIVLIFFMVIATLNFARHFLALRRLSLRPYAQDAEGKAIVVLLFASVAGVAAILTWAGTYASFAESLRHSALNVVSMATTAGFVSQDYGQWPVFAPFWMLFLSSILCSTGSTGGGIKMFRTLLLARQAGRELKLLVHPNAVVPVRVGGKAIPDRVGDSVLAFIFLYFMTAVLLTFALLVTGLDFETAFTAVIASLNNAGPGLGSVGPAGNYQGLTDFQTWVCTLAMLLGRLEIFSVLVLLTPAFWRK
jgi:trk system potassium uptake protein TrkH